MDAVASAWSPLNERSADIIEGIHPALDGKASSGANIQGGRGRDSHSARAARNTKGLADLAYSKRTGKNAIISTNFVFRISACRPPGHGTRRRGDTGR